MRRATSLASAMLRDAGARLFGVFWGCFLVVDLAGVLHLPLTVGLLTVLLVVGIGSWQQSRPAVLAAAGMGWLFVNGFLVNHLGVLRWEGPGDFWRLLALVAVAWSVARRGDLDGFLTRRRRSRRAWWVRSDGAPANPAGPVTQEEHAIGG